MMDSQENTLGQEKTEELQNTAPAENGNMDGGDTVMNNETEDTTAAQTGTAAENGTVDGETPEHKKAYKTKKEVIERIKEIAHSADNPKKDEVEYLKTAFYKLHFAEREADMKTYIEGGGDPSTYKALPDADGNLYTFA